MWKRVLRWLALPQLDDPDQKRAATLVWVIGWGILGITLASAVIMMAWTGIEPIRLVTHGAFLLLGLSVLFLLDRGKVRLASTVLTFFLWLFFALGIIISGGIHSPLMPGLFFINIAVGLFLSFRVAFFTTAATILFGLAAVSLEYIGGEELPLVVYRPGEIWFIYLTYIVSSIGVLAIYTSGLNAVVQQYRQELNVRQRVEGALDESEHRFRSLIERTNDGVFFISLDGVVLGANQRAADMFAIGNPALLVGEPADQYIVPQERAKFRTDLDDLASGKSLSLFERTYRRVDGSIFSGEVNVMLVSDQAGKPLHVQSVVRDITERKRAESQQEEFLSHLQYRSNQILTAVEVSKNCSSLLDLDELIWRVVDLVQDRFRYYYTGLFLVDETGELAILRAGSGDVGRQMVAQNHTLEVGGLSMVGWAIQNNQPRISMNVGEETIHFKNPLLPDTRAEVALPLEVRGKVIGALTVQSVSGEGFSEEEVAVLQIMADHMAVSIQNAQLFQALQRQVAETDTLRRTGAIVNSTLDLTQAIERILEQLSQVVPYDSATVQLIQEGMMEVVGGRGFPWSIEKELGKRYPITGDNVAAMVFASRQPHIIGDVQQLSIGFESNEYQYIHGWLGVPLIAQGEIIGMITLDSKQVEHFTGEHARLATAYADQVAIAIDNARLHDRVKQYAGELEQRVRERTAQLEAANQELESFAYTVSHDLRAPLRAINGFSGILLTDHGDAIPADARRYLQLVRDNALRMGELIDDLLEFSRLGRKPIQREQVDLAALVRQVIDELFAGQEKREIEIVIRELPPCQADPALLRLVFQNLLGNAVKFTRYKDSPQVEVGYVATEHGPAYYVRDNGAGFDMRYADKLFGVFQRLHRQEEFEGTGVGLATVQRIVHRHGGMVWADSVPEVGATFYFTLPGE